MYDSDQERQMLEEVKAATEREKKRYHDDYETAESVRDNFISDIQSSAAKDVNSKLEHLGLHTLPKLKGELLALCRDAGVGS